MKVNVRRLAFQALTPLLWAGVLILWAILSLVLLVQLAPNLFRWIFDTDPNPPGEEKSDPSEGRFLVSQTK